MPKRSQYLGVYNVAQDQIRDENKTFRVAIKFRDRKTGEQKWFNVPEHFTTEVAAARVYNAYAIRFFGKGAILNDLDPAQALGAFDEVHGYFHAAGKENRAQVLQASVKRVNDLRQAGHSFRTHVEVNRA